MLCVSLKTVALPVGLTTLLFVGVLKAPTPVENVIAYQGRAIGSDGNNFDGMADFRFALVDDTGTIQWSNSPLDGSFIPMNAVTLQVTKGLFSILLGDSGQDPISDSVFTDYPILFLRIWFDDKLGGGNEQLAPDQRIALLGRAFFAKVAGDAATLEGSASSDFLDKETYDTDDDGSVGDAEELDGLDSSEFGILADDNNWTGNINTFDNTVSVSGTLRTPSVQSENGSLALMAGDGEGGDLTMDADGKVIVTAKGEVKISSSFSDVNINALDGSINLNASVTTINLNADTSLMGELDMNGNDITNVGENITGNAGLSVSATGSGNTLTLSSDDDINVNAPFGSITLATASSTIFLTAVSSVAENNTVVDVAQLSHEVDSGNGDDGIGVALRFDAESDSGTGETIGRIEAVATDASFGSIDSKLSFFTRLGGFGFNEAMVLDGAGNLTLTGALVVGINMPGVSIFHGDIDMNGNDIFNIGGDLTGSAGIAVSAGDGGNLDLNALNGDINLNASNTTIKLNASSEIDGTLEVIEYDMNTAGVTDVLTLSHEIGGPMAADGIGTEILLMTQNSAGSDKAVGEIVATLDEVSPGSEFSTLRFFTRDPDGLNEVMSIDGNGDVTIGGILSAGASVFSNNLDLEGNDINNVGTVDFGAAGDDDLVASDVSTLTGSTDASALHHHDDSYFTETELGSTVGTTGAGLIGVKDEFDNSANTDVQNVLNDFDMAISSAAVQQNLFQTISVPLGTDPVADGASDILSFLQGSGITISGSSGSDSVTIGSSVDLQDAFVKGNSITAFEDTGVEIDDDGGSSASPNLKVTSSTVLTGANGRSIIVVTGNNDHNTSGSVTAIEVDLNGNYTTGNNDTTSTGIVVDLEGVTASSTDTLIGVDVLMPNSTDVGLSTDGSLVVDGDTQLGTTPSNSITLKGTVDNGGNLIRFGDDLSLAGAIKIDNTTSTSSLSFIANSNPRDLTIDLSLSDPTLYSDSGTVITVDEDLDVSGETSTTNVLLGNGNANSEGYVAVTLTSTHGMNAGSVVAIDASGRAFATDPDPGTDAIGVTVEDVAGGNLPVTVAIAGIVMTKTEGNIDAGEDVGGCGNFGNADVGCPSVDILGLTIEGTIGGFAKVLIRLR